MGFVTQLSDRQRQVLSTNPNPAMDTEKNGWVDTEKFCQLLLSQLLSQSDAIAAYLTITDAFTQRSVSLLQTLEPEVTFDSPFGASFTALKSQLQTLTLGQFVQISESQQAHFYCYGLGDRDGTLEYFSLLTHQPLDRATQQFVMQQGQLLQAHLALCWQCSQQIQESQLLERVIQKSEHQFRNALALIGLCADNLCLGLSNGLLKEEAQNIREAVTEIGDRLGDLLSCTQQTQLRLSANNLHTIVMQSLKGLRSLQVKQEVEIQCQETEAWVWVDPWQLKQVFDNLLMNALYFSSPGSVVVCDWHCYREECLVEIRDQGAGLSETDLRNLFTPFYSRRLGGQGLGLAIARKIILDHHGRLWANNLPERGAQFSFTLPRSRSPISQ